MMKKFLFMAAVTAVALSSCSKDETVGTPANEQNEINFSTYVGNTTKAVLLDDNFDSFAVNAEYTVTDGSAVEYFTTQATRTTGASATPWVTANTFFWPTSGSLSFYAYNDDLGKNTAVSPADIVTPTFTGQGTGNTLAFASTTGTDDLVVATATVSAPADHATAASAVELSFQHALTKVKVALKGDVTSSVSPTVDEGDDYKFVITSVILNGITAGTYTYSTGFNVPTSGAYDMTYTSSAADEIIGAATDSDITEEYMLIPGTAATITVEYTVYHKADSGAWVEIAAHTSTDAKKVSIASLGAAGKNTLYTLSLPIDGKPIVFTGSELTGWSDATGESSSVE